MDIYGGTIWLEGEYITPTNHIFVSEGVVMLPFREVVERLLGGQVSWDAATRTASAQVGSLQVQLALNTTNIPYTIVNDRIFIPAQHIENLFLAQ